MRDVVQDPISEAEFAQLLTDPGGRTRVPFTRVGKAAVLGYDPIRLQEYLAAEPEAPVIAHVRWGEPSSEQLLQYLHDESIPHAARDVDAEPLSSDELWQLLTIPGSNIRTPYTLVGDEVVLGYDIPKLGRLLGMAQ